jgi:hypothetical protein
VLFLLWYNNKRLIKGGDIMHEGQTPMRPGHHCCGGHFPTFAVIMFIIGIFWLLNDLELFAVKIPWLPIVLIVLAISWIIGFYKKK